MAKITICNSQSEIFEIIDTSDYDLSKAFAKACLIEEIFDWVETADKSEEVKNAH